MLSVASLLNPVKLEPRGTPLPSSPQSSLCASSPTHGSPQISTQPSVKKSKMTKDGAVFAKGKIKGEINYPAFEILNEETLREVQKFQVYPLGKIQEYCRHIPYNSEKKSFLEKTGRESFEVFQYTFKVPSDEKEYCVMWDYNIGLVRITPFFKCCKYSKTTPAKMLNLNPGLKEITHSITGGALAAQGYWMPYACALEVCTTFCAHIAGALIPIFGPSFPSRCVPVEAPEHGRMKIDPKTVHEATVQAETYRLRYSTYTPSSKSSLRESYSPQQTTRPYPHRRAHAHVNSAQILDRRLRLKRAFGSESPYESTTSDTDLGDTSSGEGGYVHSNSPTTPVLMSSTLSRPRPWESLGHNQNTIVQASSSPPSPYKGPNPLLSAIPRSTGVVDMQMALVHNNCSGIEKGQWPQVSSYITHGSHHGYNHCKRRVEDLDADKDYDGGEESGSVTGTDDRGSVDGKISEHDDVSMAGSADVSVVGGTSSGVGNATSTSIGGAEKKAAWLLMRLSVKDGESGSGSPDLGADESEGKVDGPMLKKRRVVSM